MRLRLTPNITPSPNRELEGPLVGFARQGLKRERKDGLFSRRETLSIIYDIIEKKAVLDLKSAEVIAVNNIKLHSSQS